MSLGGPGTTSLTERMKHQAGAAALANNPIAVLFPCNPRGRPKLCSAPTYPAWTSAGPILTFTIDIGRFLTGLRNRQVFRQTVDVISFSRAASRRGAALCCETKESPHM